MHIELILNYEFITISLLNGISFGLLLFLLSAGLTLILSMMGVLNFAHASFYMLGAYFGYTISQYVGYWAALVLAPLAVGLLGAGIEKYGLRRTHKFGHVPELLFTFGLTFIIVELVQLFWGRNALPFRGPELLEGSAFTIFTSTFPKHKVFMMGAALFMLLVLYVGLTRTRIGLIIQAALTHPETVQALGHNVPRVFMMVFGGGTALAALAGVIGGPSLLTDPSMAATVGSIIFVVVVVGGMGSLAGAFIASILIGCLQTFAVGIETSLLSLLEPLGLTMHSATFGYAVMSLKVSQIAPILPYLILVLILIFRPKGLLGKREG